MYFNQTHAVAITPDGLLIHWELQEKAVGWEAQTTAQPFDSYNTFSYDEFAPTSLPARFTFLAPGLFVPGWQPSSLLRGSWSGTQAWRSMELLNPCESGVGTDFQAITSTGGTVTEINTTWFTGSNAARVNRTSANPVKGDVVGANLGRSIPGVRQARFHFHFYVAAMPSAEIDIASFFLQVASNLEITLDNTGTLRVRKQNDATTAAVISSSITTGTWYYVQCGYDTLSTSAQGFASLNHGPEVATAGWVQTPEDIWTARIGTSGSATATYDIYYDDIYTAQGWGPLPWTEYGYQYNLGQAEAGTLTSAFQSGNVALPVFSPGLFVPGLFPPPSFFPQFGAPTTGPVDNPISVTATEATAATIQHDVGHLLAATEAEVAYALAEAAPPRPVYIDAYAPGPFISPANFPNQQTFAAPGTNFQISLTATVAETGSIQINPGINLTATELELAYALAEAAPPRPAAIQSVPPGPFTSPLTFPTLQQFAVPGTNYQISVTATEAQSATVQRNVGIQSLAAVEQSAAYVLVEVAPPRPTAIDTYPPGPFISPAGFPTFTQFAVPLAAVQFSLTATEGESVTVQRDVGHGIAATEGQSGSNQDNTGIHLIATVGEQVYVGVDVAPPRPTAIDLYAPGLFVSPQNFPNASFIAGGVTQGQFNYALTATEAQSATVQRDVGIQSITAVEPTAAYNLAEAAPPRPAQMGVVPPGPFISPASFPTFQAFNAPGTAYQISVTATEGQSVTQQHDVGHLLAATVAEPAYVLAEAAPPRPMFAQTVPPGPFVSPLTFPPLIAFNAPGAAFNISATATEGQSGTVQHDVGIHLQASVAELAYALAEAAPPRPTSLNLLPPGPFTSPATFPNAALILGQADSSKNNPISVTATEPQSVTQQHDVGIQSLAAVVTTQAYALASQAPSPPVFVALVPPGPFTSPITFPNLIPFGAPGRNIAISLTATEAQSATVQRDVGSQSEQALVNDLAYMAWDPKPAPPIFIQSVPPGPFAIGGFPPKPMANAVQTPAGAAFQLTAVQTQTGSLQRDVGHTLTASVSEAGSLSRSMGVSLVGTVTQTINVKRARTVTTTGGVTTVVTCVAQSFIPSIIGYAKGFTGLTFSADSTTTKIGSDGSVSLAPDAKGTTAVFGAAGSSGTSSDAKGTVIGGNP